MSLGMAGGVSQTRWNQQSHAQTNQTIKLYIFPLKTASKSDSSEAIKEQPNLDVQNIYLDLNTNKSNHLAHTN